MFFINVRFNKTAFILILVWDMFLLYTAYHIAPYILLSCVLGVVLFPIKYFMFLLSFRYLNRKNLYMSFAGLVLSMAFELLICLRSISIIFTNFLFLFYIPEICAVLVFPFSFILKLIFLIMMMVLTKFVISGVDIPVSKLDGNYRRKIDEWADKIPGL